MKGFIEVTDYDGGMKVLCPIHKITGIVCDGDGACLSKWARTRAASRRAYLYAKVLTKSKPKSKKARSDNVQSERQEN